MSHKLPESVRQQIREAYESTKQSMPGFRDRFQQRKMIGEVASTLAGQKKDKPVLVVEGPTGTGKTLAYLLAAIPVAQYYGKKLVISSATVALQEQLIFQDLPLINKQSVYDFNTQIAKGRGRYACIRKMQILGGDDTQDTLNFGQALWDAPPEKQELSSIQNAFKLYKDGKWNGDLDLLPIPLKRNLWPKISNTFHGCTGSRCRDYKRCAFYLERKKTGSADVIVANHDLVLADIASGGGTVLPLIEDSFYIFDEAHHLPNKAISHFAASAAVVGAAEWLKTINQAFSKEVASSTMQKAQVTAKQIADELAISMRELHDLMQTLPLAETLKTKEHMRFAFGVPNQEIIEFGERKIWQPLKRLYKTLDSAVEISKQDFDKNDTNIIHREQQMSALSFLFGRTENLYKLWGILLSSDKNSQTPIARWVSQTDSGDYIFNVSPISAAEHLKKSLWDKTSGCILTSATLTALNSFARFEERTGLSEDNAQYLRLPSPFDLSRVNLKITDMQQSPKDALGHTQEIIRLSANLLTQSQGTLVLFSSRRQMQDVYEGLSLRLKKQVTIQGDDSKQHILTAHKKRIKEGKPSAIFGLASFAEGMDLPGNLCEHVIIAKLPFAVPTSPIEEATAEYVESTGKNHFFSVSLPDASVKLIQACGRLMRSETDQGRITILDNRLLQTSYGKILLKGLPGYKLVAQN